MDLETEILSVSEISNFITEVFDEYFYFINVEGEITNISKSSNGHIYFSLKDENSIINAICWKNIESEFKEKIIEGQYVVCSGEIKIYSKSSRYQIILRSIRVLDANGKFLLQLEKLKTKLKSEGLFDLERKKQIPSFPEKIALITSSSGAVIEDMLHRIKDRFPCEVILFSVQVQGKDAIEKIIDGLKIIDKKDFDLIIVARGGGSKEELSCFNDEKLIRFVSKLKTPLVSAIGHETDWCLLDLVADLRAPTPTAAIELTLPLRREIEEKIFNSFLIVEEKLLHRMEIHNFKLSNFYLLKHTIDRKILDNNITLDEKNNEMKNLLIKNIYDIEHDISIKNANLEIYNFKRIMSLGFIVVKQDSKVIQLKEEILKNKPIELCFLDGILSVKVES